jgi:heme oxygenase (biliverdin-producing, ferredoxin)
MTTMAPLEKSQSIEESLSAKLKRTTAELHTRAEQSPTMRELAQGKMSREGFTAHLGQLYLLHDGLERRLALLLSSEHRMGHVVKTEQFQTDKARADLEYFGASHETIEASAALSTFLSGLETVAQDRPWALLGMHYVLEGSKNGGRFLARVVRKAYELEVGNGDRYLDPYGESQPATWGTFKTALDSLELSEVESEDVLYGAEKLFELMIALGTPAG